MKNSPVILMSRLFTGSRKWYIGPPARAAILDRVIIGMACAHRSFTAVQRILEAETRQRQEVGASLCLGAVRIWPRGDP